MLWFCFAFLKQRRQLEIRFFLPYHGPSNNTTVKNWEHRRDGIQASFFSEEQWQDIDPNDDLPTTVKKGDFALADDCPGVGCLREVEDVLLVARLW